jgi:hypothetical protein
LSPQSNGTELNDVDEFVEELDREIINLSRRKEALLSQGKHTQAAELDAAIETLEEELAEEEEEIKRYQVIQALLAKHGFILERGIEGYRVTVKGTDVTLLGKRAMLPDVEAFAAKLRPVSI